MPSVGRGVEELRVWDESGTYCVIYVARFAEAVYVLHAFQKKSPKGIKTAQTDVQLVARRLKVAQEDYEAGHGRRSD